MSLEEDTAVQVIAECYSVKVVVKLEGKNNNFAVLYFGHYDNA